MPFTGQGTGIQNADDVFFSALANQHILRYDTATAKWINTALTVTTTAVANDAITEPKLAVSNAPSSNQVLGWNGTSLAWMSQTASTPTATTTTQGTVQLAGDLSGTAVAPTVPGLATKEPTIASGTTSQYYRGDKSWQALDKSAVGLANVDNTSDASKPVSTATQTALNQRALTSTTISGIGSITGGGSLASNRTISLTNDATNPGNSKYYGTDAAGAKGYHDVPVSNPTVGGDLSGTASNAQIVAGAVGSAELATSAVTAVKIADNAVVESKLNVTNTPATGQVLSWNGTNMAWAGALAFAFTRVNVTSNYTATSYEYVFADASSGGITVTLPSPQNNAYVRVKRMSGGANGVQVQAPAGSYLDAASVGTDVLNNQYDSSEYWSDGVNWYR